MNITAPTVYAATITFQAPSYLLGNVSRARRFNEAVIDAIGMRQLGESIAYSVPTQLRAQGGEPYHDEGGVSCMSLLSTSGIEIHTWPDITTEGKVRGSNPGVAYVRVDSCRTFEYQHVEHIIMEMYQASNIKTTVFTIRLDRGM